MDIEQKQAEIIDDFVKKASTLTGSALPTVVVEATSHPSLFAFSEILSVPNISQLEGTADSSYLNLLQLFAYGTWSDYKSSATSLPQLVPDQILKLKQLTVLTMAENSKVLPYDQLMQELDVTNVRELEDFLINECMYAGIVRGKLDQLRRCFEVQFAAGRDLRPGQLGNMIDTLTSWLSTSDNLLVTIQEKIKWADTMSELEKKERKDFEDRVEEVKKTVSLKRRRLMDHWTGIFKVPLCKNDSLQYRVAASLCVGPSKSLIVPSANAIFFNGDRIEGTGNPVIDRLSNVHNIAEILMSKFGRSVNVWVVEASCFNGAFAVYKDFVPSVNQWGEPSSYNPAGFPAATTTVTLLSNCLAQVLPLPCFAGAPLPKTFIIGFSKGGIVLNQLLSELSFSGVESSHPDENLLMPKSGESLLNSITDIHYVDVGLNSAGAYLNDSDTIDRISDRILRHGAAPIRFILHGTPRQWCDRRRSFIRQEKDRLLKLLQHQAQRTGGKIEVSEKFYFADESPELQMHFEIIEVMDVS